MTMANRRVIVLAVIGALILGGGLYFAQFRAQSPNEAKAFEEGPRSVAPRKSAETPQSQVGVGNSISPTIEPSRPMSRPTRSVHREPALESVLYSGGNLNAKTAEAVLAGDFASALRTMRSDSVGDQDAQGLTRLYSQAIASTLLEVSAAAKVKDIACGASICGVDIRGKSGSPELMRDLLDAGSRGGPRIYSAVTHVVPLSDGSYSYRMFFSTDPGVKRIVVPPATPEPTGGAN